MGLTNNIVNAHPPDNSAVEKKNYITVIICYYIVKHEKGHNSQIALIKIKINYIFQ
jgi:hypothetical protein